MRVEVEWVGDVDGGLAELEAHLRQDPRLDGVPFGRGRPTVPPESLGAAEVLEFVATNVSLGLVANALYDFLRGRLRTRPGDERVRLLLTRTDLPGGARRVEIDYSGPPEAAAKAIRDALSD